MICKTCGKQKPTQEEWDEHDHEGKGCLVALCGFYWSRCWDVDSECLYDGVCGNIGEHKVTELDKAIIAMLAVPCNVEKDNRASYERRLAALLKST